LDCTTLPDKIGFYLFIYIVLGVTVGFIKILIIYQIYHSWIYPHHHSPLFSPLPIPGIVSTVLIFPLTYMCTQYLYYIHPRTPFPHILPLPQPPRQDLTLLFSDFVKTKRFYFFLFKIAIQGVSLWHFYIYMYCNLNWFISSIFLLSTLVSF
jgi:hypothetical protein